MQAGVTVPGSLLWVSPHLSGPGVLGPRAAMWPWVPAPVGPRSPVSDRSCHRGVQAGLECNGLPVDRDIWEPQPGRAASGAGLCRPPWDGVRRALASLPGAPSGPAQVPPPAWSLLGEQKTDLLDHLRPVPHTVSLLETGPRGQRWARQQAGKGWICGFLKISCSLGLCHLTLTSRALEVMGRDTAFTKYRRFSNIPRAAPRPVPGDPSCRWVGVGTAGAR